MSLSKPCPYLSSAVESEMQIRPIVMSQKGGDRPKKKVTFNSSSIIFVITSDESLSVEDSDRSSASKVDVIQVRPTCTMTGTSGVCRSVGFYFAPCCVFDQFNLHLFLSEVSSTNFPFFVISSHYSVKSSAPEEEFPVNCACGNQRTACGNAFSPSAMWVPEIKPQTSGLAASSPSRSATSPALSNVFFSFHCYQ